MKKWSGGVIILSLLALLVLRYGIMDNSLVEYSLQNPFSRNNTDHPHWLTAGDLHAVKNPEHLSEVISADTFACNLFAARNLSVEEISSLQTWNHLHHLISRTDGLPHAIEAIKEAEAAWKSLMASVEDEKQVGSGNGSVVQKVKQCPYSIRRMNASESETSKFKLKVPCGLVQGSSITVIGTPKGLLGNFHIDLIGSTLPGEPDPPIILHYNVRLLGDKITEDPVIVQNTWTATTDWGAEERCPSKDADSNKKGGGILKLRFVGRKGKHGYCSSMNSNPTEE